MRNVVQNTFPRLPRTGSRVALILLCALALATPVLASGSSRSSGRSGAGGHGPGGGGRGVSIPRPATDVLYERGKAVFLSERQAGKNRGVCVLPADPEAKGVLEVNRRTLKPFAGESVQRFLPRLVSCGERPVSLTRSLASRDLQALVHFLSQRYKLYLSS